MSPTLAPETTSADLKAVLSEVGWHDVHRDPQNSAWNPNRDLLTALSNVAARDAAARLGALAASRQDVTSMPEALSKPLPFPVGWPPGRLTRSGRVPTRIVSDPSGRDRHLMADPRGLSKLRFTPRHYHQVRRTRLRSADSDVRARAYERFQLLRQWEGDVTELEASHFRAAVVTVDAASRLRREHMRFPMALVRKQDHDAVAEGAPFYYCVGRFISRGQITPGSLLWFRRFRENAESVESLMSRAEAQSRIEWTS